MGRSDRHDVAGSWVHRIAYSTSPRGTQDEDAGGVSVGEVSDSILSKNFLASLRPDSYNSSLRSSDKVNSVVRTPTVSMPIVVSNFFSSMYSRSCASIIVETKLHK